MSTEPQHPASGESRESWRRFLDTYEPLRPDLYRYCRHLTRSPWDAEDIVQETLARAFVTLGTLLVPPNNPRAWLFRVASNGWLNRMRQTREHADEAALERAETTIHQEPRGTREAGGTLLAHLSPQERAAVVLKDAFGLTLEEIADTLATTPGAVKTALHRGRGKLVVVEPEQAQPVAPAVLDAFCRAFDARDLDRLTALLLDDATLGYPGIKLERGAEAIRTGSFQGTLFGCPEGQQGGVSRARSELRAHRGEWIMLWWSDDEVHAVVRVELAGDRIRRLCNYYHAPELLDEVCRELQVPSRSHGYHPGPAWF